MRIGLVYDLRDDYRELGYTEEQTAEFDARETIDALTETIESLGHKVEQVGNFKELLRALNMGKSWDLVFNIAEGMYGSSREAQVPAILDAFQIPYTFSSPLEMAVTMDKAIAKRIVRDHGISTTPFAVVHNEDEIRRVKLSYPLFAKPLAEGTGKGVTAASRITSQEELHNYCLELLARFNQPVLIEPFLSGREFTVGILGQKSEARVIGVLEVCLRKNAEAWCHSYHNKENCEELVDYRLVDDETSRQAAEIALRAWNALGCVDGGRVDIRCDRFGQPFFLEANPLSGLRPGHSDLVILAQQAGISYVALIREIIENACKRNHIQAADSHALLECVI